jgi:hypothetical protein
MDVPEPPHEEPSEATEGDRATEEGGCFDPEGGQLADECRGSQPQDARRDDLGTGVVVWTDVS